MEPIFKENAAQNQGFPVQHPNLWSLYKEAEAAFWTADEVDAGPDLADWDNFHAEGRGFLACAMVWILEGDQGMKHQLLNQFLQEVDLPETRSFFAFQKVKENIHFETWCRLLEAYLESREKIEKVVEKVSEESVFERRIQWVEDYTAPENSLAERLVALATLEGIFGSLVRSSFYWLQREELFPGLTYANDLVSRDRRIHRDFAGRLHGLLVHPLSAARILEIITSAVALEKELVVDALPVSGIGLDPLMVTTFIEFEADRLLVALGQPRVYGSVNPFPWMEPDSFQSDSNLLEPRPGEMPPANALKRKGNNY
ncbi:MAG: ribonucleotide-diphosphate reductase subunit beta [Bacteroidia bacterium]|nr:ribonucleotide-diphosphate reductase subunit beta [Bacteroidia bacterium]